jgi:hypothetical protein
MPRMLRQWLTGVLTGHACAQQADRIAGVLGYGTRAVVPGAAVTDMEQVRALRT